MDLNNGNGHGNYGNHRDLNDYHPIVTVGTLTELNLNNIINFPNANGRNDEDNGNGDDNDGDDDDEPPARRPRLVDVQVSLNRNQYLNPARAQVFDAVISSDDDSVIEVFSRSSSPSVDFSGHESQEDRSDHDSDSTSNPSDHDEEEESRALSPLINFRSARRNAIIDSPGIPEVNQSRIDNAFIPIPSQNNDQSAEPAAATSGEGLNLPNPEPGLQTGDVEQERIPKQESSTAAPHEIGASVGVNTSTVSDDPDTNCLICYEPFTNSGEHRISCLKCGHTFGKNCIDKWLKSEARCPQCNSRASRKDVRVIYVKNLLAIDTAERDRALDDLRSEREGRRRMELECSKLRQKYETQEQELISLRLEFAYMKSRIGGMYRLPETEQVPAHQPVKESGFHYNKIRAMDLPGECRVGVFNPWLNFVAVSGSTKSPLYPNGLHGIRRINLLDLSVSPPATLHQKEIRDLSFSPSQSDTLLSVGMDRRAVLTNCNSNVQIQTFQTDSPLWSCAWNLALQYVFYVGGATGGITAYDIRKPNEIFSQDATPDGDKSPIVRLLFIPPSYVSQQKFSKPGLLVQKLGSVWFYDPSSPSDEAFCQLPLDGPFISSSFDPISRHLLVTTKGRCEVEGRHSVCELGEYMDSGRTTVGSSIINTWQNQMNLTKLTRSCIFSANRHVLIAANAPRNTVSLWNLSDPTWKQNLLVTEPVLDFIPCSLNGSNLLATIRASGVDMYKGQQMDGVTH